MTRDDRQKFVEAVHLWMGAVMHNSLQTVGDYTRRHGLSFSQIRTLFMVNHHRMDGLNHLGHKLGITNAAASQMLDRLVQGGYVSRSENSEDRRAISIDLTEKGRAVVQEAMEQRSRWILMLADNMTSEERKDATRVLNMLAKYTTLQQGGRR